MEVASSPLKPSSVDIAPPEEFTGDLLWEGEGDPFEKSAPYQSELQAFVRKMKKASSQFIDEVLASVLSKQEKSEIEASFGSFFDCFDRYGTAIVAYKDIGADFFSKWGAFRAEAEAVISKSDDTKKLLQFYSQQIALSQKYMKQVAAKFGDSPVFQEIEELYAAAASVVADCKENIRTMSEPLASLNLAMTKKVRPMLSGRTGILQEQFKYSCDCIKRVVDSFKTLLSTRKEYFVLMDRFAMIENDFTVAFVQFKGVLVLIKSKQRKIKEEKDARKAQNEIERNQKKKQLPKYKQIKLDVSREKPAKISLRPQNKKYLQDLQKKNPFPDSQENPNTEET